jgi:hypothetical protein
VPLLIADDLLELIDPAARTLRRDPARDRHDEGNDEDREGDQREDQLHSGASL